MSTCEVSSREWQDTFQDWGSAPRFTGLVQYDASRTTTVAAIPLSGPLAVYENTPPLAHPVRRQGAS